MKINKIKLNSFIKSFPDITRSGVSFSQISSIGIGGEIGAICDVKNTKELTDVLAWLKNAKLHYYVLGNGTNIVGRDGGFSGVVIRLVGEFRQVASICLFSAKNFKNFRLLDWSLRMESLGVLAVVFS